jgi:hypothetical protein
MEFWGAWFDGEPPLGCVDMTQSAVGLFIGHQVVDSSTENAIPVSKDVFITPFAGEANEYLESLSPEALSRTKVMFRGRPYSILRSARVMVPDGDCIMISFSKVLAFSIFGMTTEISRDSPETSYLANDGVVIPKIYRPVDHDISRVYTLHSQCYMLALIFYFSQIRNMDSGQKHVTGYRSMLHDGSMLVPMHTRAHMQELGTMNLAYKSMLATSEMTTRSIRQYAESKDYSEDLTSSDDYHDEDADEQFDHMMRANILVLFLYLAAIEDDGGYMPYFEAKKDPKSTKASKELGAFIVHGATDLPSFAQTIWDVVRLILWKKNAWEPRIVES